MLKRILTALLALLGLKAPAQVTLRLPALPPGTPPGATIYVAGSFNEWNPASPAHALTRAADGSYEISLPPTAGPNATIEYKFTRGSWATVETAAGQADAPNRRYTFGPAPATVVGQVLGWKDLGPPAAAPPSTAAANVQVISEAFGMPQLAGRTRRVWLYLPLDYAAQPARRYPVLYLQDGQNVFDAATAFAGEWGVDETLNELRTSCIVVAVDNGGAKRLDEYSPWPNANARYGGGEGDQYLDFVVQTLKPHIDAHYRTQPGRESTGIGGSSMGGLIATYAALKYPAVFGKVAAFSPAYWFAEKPLFDYLRQHPADPATRFYLVCGTTESPTMAPLMTALRDALQAGGVPPAHLSLHLRPDGKHAEWFWRREFAAGFSWLYAPPALPVSARHRRAGTRAKRLSYPPVSAGRRAEPARGKPQ